MPGIGCRFLTPAACLALIAAAPEQLRPPLDSLFEAADRGELAPVAEALETTRDADSRTLLRARLAAARFDSSAGRDPALARLASGDDPAERRAALTVMASTAFAGGDYAEAARTARLLEQALTEAGEAEAAAAAGRTGGVAELLVGRPSQQIVGEVAPGSIAARYDRVGLPRVEVAVNGRAQEAVVDTGANLSVLSRETARRLGIEIAEAETRVSNGVEGTVPVRIGVADRLEIAGTVLRNVPFLIIDDEQLTFPLPGGYDIRAIIGLPVLRALGRFRIENQGRFAVLPAAGAAGSESNLHASGNDLFVDVTIDGRNVPLHLDTGANQSSLSALYAAANPAAIAGLQADERRTASAGGMRRAPVATWQNAPIRLGGRALVLSSLPVSLPAEGPKPRFYGTLGSNALRAFESYTVDFAAMRLELGEPVRAEAP